MSSTPTDGSAQPSSDGGDPTTGGAPSDPVPAPRSGPHPLPRRRARDADRGPGAGRGPDGRRPGAPDEATLDRLLAGLREI